MRKQRLKKRSKSKEQKPRLRERKEILTYSIGDIYNRDLKRRVER